MNIDNSEETLLMLRLLRASYWFEDGLRRELTRRGLQLFPRAQAAVLIHVAMGIRKQSQLAEALGISRQAVSRIVGDLIQAGALKAITDPEDGRALLVEHHPAADKELSEALKILTALERKLGAIIGDDRVGVLRTALDMDWGEPGLAESGPATK